MSDAREELVEKMARALCAADGLNPDHFDDDDRMYGWQLYTRWAVAALAAIEEQNVVVPKRATHAMFVSALPYAEDPREAHKALIQASPLYTKEK